MGRARRRAAHAPTTATIAPSYWTSGPTLPVETATTLVWQRRRVSVATPRPAGGKDVTG